MKRKVEGYFPFDGEEQRTLREKAVAFLGGKCANPKCLVPNGCSDKRCLQVDHINGVWNEPRKVGCYLYEDILYNPESKKIYQLLCANCNWIKRAEKNENRGGAPEIKPLKPKVAYIGFSEEDKHHLR